ncbi:hypothetical protein NQ152_16130 [Microbacterium sp. zg.B48]|uniref:hypothetical protein n=1 Tax=Microbacterium sp. zg.B48 TaxID=2969408 RepID=UPI00214C9CAA|nr:hypothetical protein [Microbacterium sp. zg.B48]MCR2765032.1 hypothetical protein [Microbacterium sp. zg.B48]
MPTVTDWISSIAALVGGLAGLGALIISFLSYRKAGRALSADARTRRALTSTFAAVQALGEHNATVDQTVAAALRSTHGTDAGAPDAGNRQLRSPAAPDHTATRDAYADAVGAARRLLDEIGRD